MQVQRLLSHFFSYYYQELIDMSLEDIPSALADFTGITESTAQVLLSIAVILAVVLPVAYFTKGNVIASVISFFFSEALCVGLTWLPFWFIIVTIMVVVALFAGLTSQGVTGGG